jgi:hypothetical protein
VIRSARARGQTGMVHSGWAYDGMVIVSADRRRDGASSLVKTPDPSELTTFSSPAPIESRQQTVYFLCWTYS